jgi:hypothetical protein
VTGECLSDWLELDAGRGLVEEVNRGAVVADAAESVPARGSVLVRRCLGVANGPWQMTFGMLSLFNPLGRMPSHVVQPCWYDVT